MENDLLKKGDDIQMFSTSKVCVDPSKLAEWKAIIEAHSLNAVPGLSDSIQEAMHSPDNEFSDTVEW